MSNLTTVQKLGELQDLIEPIDRKFDELDKLFDTGGSPLANAVYNLVEEYVYLIADDIKCSRSILTSWWLVHNWGKHPMRVKIGDNSIKWIRTSTELADYIEEIKHE